jgi:hypothetical protein
MCVCIKKLFKKIIRCILNETTKTDSQNATKSGSQQTMCEYEKIEKLIDEKIEKLIGYDFLHLVDYKICRLKYSTWLFFGGVMILAVTFGIYRCKPYYVTNSAGFNDHYDATKINLSVRFIDTTKTNNISNAKNTTQMDDTTKTYNVTKINNKFNFNDFYLVLVTIIGLLLIILSIIYKYFISRSYFELLKYRQKVYLDAWKDVVEKELEKWGA